MRAIHYCLGNDRGTPLQSEPVTVITTKQVSRPEARATRSSPEAGSWSDRHPWSRRGDGVASLRSLSPRCERPDCGSGARLLRRSCRRPSARRPDRLAHRIAGARSRRVADAGDRATRRARATVEWADGGLLPRGVVRCKNAQRSAQAERGQIDAESRVRDGTWCRLSAAGALGTALGRNGFSFPRSSGQHAAVLGR
jgi:hypothetical protein